MCIVDVSEAIEKEWLRMLATFEGHGFFVHKRDDLPIEILKTKTERCQWWRYRGDEKRMAWCPSSLNNYNKGRKIWQVRITLTDRIEFD
jgi:hypothetical protein